MTCYNRSGWSLTALELRGKGDGGYMSAADSEAMRPQTKRKLQFTTYCKYHEFPCLYFYSFF